MAKPRKTRSKEHVDDSNDIDDHEVEEGEEAEQQNKTPLKVVIKLAPTSTTSSTSNNNDNPVDSENVLDIAADLEEAFAEELLAATSSNEPNITDEEDADETDNKKKGKRKAVKAQSYGVERTPQSTNKRRAPPASEPSKRYSSKPTPRKSRSKDDSEVPTPMELDTEEQNEVTKADLLAILDRMFSADKKRIFWEPVPRDVPEYYTIIKKPMDLTTMRTKVNQMKYSKFRQFKDDLDLIFTNCMEFNEPSTIFYKEATRLAALAKELTAHYRPDAKVVEQRTASSATEKKTKTPKKGKATEEAEAPAKDKKEKTPKKAATEAMTPTATPSKAITEDVKKRLTGVVDEMINKDTYSIFLEPVSKKEVPAYYDIIKKPMDFTTLKKRIQTGKVASPESLREHLELIFDNCTTFNEEGSIFYNEAVRLKKEIPKLIRNLKTELEKLATPSTPAQPSEKEKKRKKDEAEAGEPAETPKPEETPKAKKKRGEGTVEPVSAESAKVPEETKSPEKGKRGRKAAKEKEDKKMDKEMADEESAATPKIKIKVSKSADKPEEGATDPAAEMKQKMLDIIAKLEAEDANKIFWKPVSEKEVPGYSDIIKHPMDFSTARKKVKKGAYTIWSAFSKDINLIFENAKTFNIEDSIFYTEAERLQKIGNDLIKPYYVPEPVPPQPVALPSPPSTSTAPAQPAEALPPQPKKRGPGRPRKSEKLAEAALAAAAAAGMATLEKEATTATPTVQPTATQAAAAPSAGAAVVPTPVKRGPGRPRKHPLPGTPGAPVPAKPAAGTEPVKAVKAVVSPPQPREARGAKQQQQQGKKTVPISEIIADLISDFESQDKAKIFAQPVNLSEVPDYLQYVEQPMDLSTMKKKLANKEYKKIEIFKNDFIVMCKNAMAYNKEGTVFYTEADRMLKYGLPKIEAIASRVKKKTPEQQQQQQQQHAATAAASASRPQSALQQQLPLQAQQQPQQQQQQQLAAAQAAMRVPVTPQQVRAPVTAAAPTMMQNIPLTAPPKGPAQMPPSLIPAAHPQLMVPAAAQQQAQMAYQQQQRIAAAAGPTPIPRLNLVPPKLVASYAQEVKKASDADYNRVSKSTAADLYSQLRPTAAAGQQNGAGIQSYINTVAQQQQQHNLLNAVAKAQPVPSVNVTSLLEASKGKAIAQPFNKNGVVGRGELNEIADLLALSNSTSSTSRIMPQQASAGTSTSSATVTTTSNTNANATANAPASAVVPESQVLFNNDLLKDIDNFSFNPDEIAAMDEDNFLSNNDLAIDGIDLDLNFLKDIKFKDLKPALTNNTNNNGSSNSNTTVDNSAPVPMETTTTSVPTATAAAH